MSMVICSKHGGQYSIHISKDLEGTIQRGERVADVQEFAFTYDGEVVQTFVVSSTVAAAAGIRGLDTAELPDHYPAWVMALVPVCEKCLEAARNKG
jgi:hypothetical protein